MRGNKGQHNPLTVRVLLGQFVAGSPGHPPSPGKVCVRGRLGGQSQRSEYAARSCQSNLDERQSIKCDGDVLLKGFWGAIEHLVNGVEIYVGVVSWRNEVLCTHLGEHRVALEVVKRLVAASRVGRNILRCLGADLKISKLALGKKLSINSGGIDPVHGADG